jgi:PE-PPE domain
MPINLFTLQGTGHRATDTGKACFPVHVAKGVDQNLFKWNPIFYPASIPFTRSVAAGVNNLDSAMKALRFNGPGVIVCYSQGAMVAKSKVNSPDVLRVVAFGNPGREAGHTYPDSPLNPSGHGIMDADSRLQNTPENWWDYVIPNDLAACMGDSEADQFVTKIFMLLSEKPHLRDIPAILLQNNIPRDKWNTVLGLVPYLTGNADGVFPHGDYADYIAPGETKTFVQMAIDSLNELGAQTLGS